MQIAKVITLLLILWFPKSQSTLNLKFDGFFNFNYGHKETSHENHATNQEESYEETSSQLSFPENSSEDTEHVEDLPIEEPPMDIYDQFSPRVLVSGSLDHPIDTSKLAVDLVRSWLSELGLFQLRNQILQAKHMTTKKGTLLFELKTALQAIQVVETLTHSPKEGLLKGLSANQTKIDFFNDFPRSEFD
ncbi:uncharacterized protein Dsimw501_GD23057 [Drosophila simulans]|uniref:Uncharacterized protein n=1 Tax=Drosophila simulans TaxID=7240 RepID=A0A0J9QTG9_DROSI|nr:uncharacterized protein Dsimw501_GD23057 [Drosophila simulans]